MSQLIIGVSNLKLFKIHNVIKATFINKLQPMLLSGNGNQFPLEWNGLTIPKINFLYNMINMIFCFTF